MLLNKIVFKLYLIGKCFFCSRQIDEYGTNAANHSPQPLWDTPQNRFPDSTHELIKPFIIQFSIILDSLTIGAAVLPSLRAQYQVCFHN